MTAPGTSGNPGIGVFLQGGATLLGRSVVDVREADLLHRVEVIEVAPILLEAMGRRQRFSMVTEVVFAELAVV